MRDRCLTNPANWVQETINALSMIDWVAGVGGRQPDTPGLPSLRSVQPRPPHPSISVGQSIRSESHRMKEASPATLDSAVARQVVERNQQTRGLQTYASHRQCTMSLLSLAAAAVSHGETASLSVLGAGNCLDLDLRVLSKHFGRINLLDLDPAAVTYAVDTQGRQTSCHRRIRLRHLAAVISCFNNVTFVTF